MYVSKGKQALRERLRPSRVGRTAYIYRIFNLFFFPAKQALRGFGPESGYK